MDILSVKSEQAQALTEGSLLAALDLGSNSFHLLIAKIEHGEIRPVEALGEKVQLGAGIIDGCLAPDAIERGLACLERFAQLLASFHIKRLRIVGTNALRIAKNRTAFTRPAQKILGTRIEVIYGREEARLVYLGVAHTLADDAQSRLVIDIGGGSTELIIGERFEPRSMESLQMGCVSYAREFFPEGIINARRFRDAYNKARLTVSEIQPRFHRQHWDECIGSSGTLRAIEVLLVAQGISEEGITQQGLAELEDQLLSYDNVESIDSEGLSNSRRGVIVPGVAITKALFDVLQIDRIKTSKGALREGVLYDLLGRLNHEDVRERTINALTLRYNVDTDLANTFERRANTLFRATQQHWNLAADDWELLRWSTRTHEIGMTISHKHFNRHSAYLLLNADLPGFSAEEQENLAVLVQGHRGKIGEAYRAKLDATQSPQLRYLVAILRLAARFKYVERLEQLPDFSIKADSQTLTLDFPENWFEEHPLTHYQLEQERTSLQSLAIELRVANAQWDDKN